MGDALRHLVSARNTLRITIGMASAAARQAIRGYDRLQRQKIRRPKQDQEEAQEIAEQIEQAADDEDFVYATLGGVLMDQERGKEKRGRRKRRQRAQSRQKTRGDGAARADRR